MKYLYHIGCLFVLMISCQDNKNINTLLPDPLQAGWKGEKVCEVLEDNAKIRVLKCSFAPSVGHEQHQHVPHFGYTLAGSEFEITENNRSRQAEVPTGTYFAKDETTTHHIVNIGNRSAQFLIIEYK